MVAVLVWVILRYLRMLLVPLGFTVDANIQKPALWLAVLAWIGVSGTLNVITTPFGFLLVTGSASFFESAGAP